MSQADMKEIFSTLFTAPVEAALLAERGYRRIWVQWLKDTQTILDGVTDEAQQLAIIKDRLDMAPIMKLEAAIEVGINMRVVSVREVEAGGEIGLGVGPFQVSGSFGFMSQSTTESTMNARARYQLSNTNELTLRKFLASTGYPEIKKTSQLNEATEKLTATLAKKETA